jgi:hypothetical protein
MSRRAKMPPMPPRDAADVWEQVAHEVALLDADDGKLSAADVRWCNDPTSINEVLALVGKRPAASRPKPTLAAGSLQPLQVEVMGMDRIALLARLKLSMRNGSLVRPHKPVESLSDDELRQLIVEAEG